MDKGQLLSLIRFGLSGFGWLDEVVVLEKQGQTQAMIPHTEFPQILLISFAMLISKDDTQPACKAESDVRLLLLRKFPGSGRFPVQSLQQLPQCKFPAGGSSDWVAVPQR